MIPFFHRLSFRGKILCTYFLFLLFTILIFIICYIQNVASSIDSNVKFMNKFNQQMELSMDTALGNGNAISYVHFYDSQLNFIFHDSNKNLKEGEQIERQNYVQKMLKVLTIMNPYALRTTIVTNSGDVYCSLVQDLDDYLGIVEPIKNAGKWEKKYQRHFTNVYAQEINNNGYSMVTSISQLYDAARTDSFASLYMDLDFGAIAGEFNTISKNAENTASVAIINDDSVLYNSQNAYVNLETEISIDERPALFEKLRSIAGEPDQSGRVTMKHTSYITAVLKNETTGWYLVQYLPETVLLRNSMNNMVNVMIWVVLLIVLAGILSVTFSRQVSRPIQKLSQVMKQADQGEVKLYEDEIERNDEIGQLIQSYNVMGHRINDSITKLYVYQLNQKQAELKMLQFQINPHFLYNALNTVSAIARLEEVPQIPEITDSLSDMFRYNIKGSDFVSLLDEITQLKNYLRIQCIRFPGRFDIEYAIPDELLSCGMLKFLLQPIVENSIQHGFSRKRPKDTLKISAECPGQSCLILKVYDDGIGIGEEQVLKMNQMLSRAKSNTLLEEAAGGIGLVNVNARLKNYYGEDYGITVESKLNKYTCIILKLKILLA